MQDCPKVKVFAAKLALVGIRQGLLECSYHLCIVGPQAGGVSVPKCISGSVLGRASWRPFGSNLRCEAPSSANPFALAGQTLSGLLAKNSKPPVAETTSCVLIPLASISAAVAFLLNGSRIGWDHWLPKQRYAAWPVGWPHNFSQTWRRRLAGTMQIP